MSLRRLEGILVALGWAAAVGENSLPNLFGSYFREWWQYKWQYINCIVRHSGRRKRRGGPYGRHSKVAGRVRAGRHDNKG
jgi:hypothetical protein